MDTHTCTQEERITRIEENVKCMDEKLDALHSNQQRTLTMLEIYVKKVDEHDAILKGENGEVGVIAKVVQAVDMLTELSIALKGKEDKPGLIAAIDVLVKRAAAEDDGKIWMRRLLIGAIITWILSVIVLVIK